MGKLLVFSALVLVWLGSAALAQDVGTATVQQKIEAARKALATGRPQDASEILDSINPANAPPGHDVPFLRGTAALQMQDWPTAIENFRAILARDPSLLRVRLDLALAFFRNGDDSSAAYHFRQALSEDLPPVVRVRALRFLEEIRRRKRWSISVWGGINIDDNRNTATTAQTVDLCIDAFGFCGPFTLSEDGRPSSGFGLLANIAGSYERPLAPNLRFRTGGALFTKTYENNNFNDHRLSAHMGPRILFRRFDLRPEVTASVRRLDDRRHSRSLGLKISSDWVVDPKLRLNASVSADRRFYDTGAEDVGDALGLILGFSRPLAKSTLLAGHLTLAQELRDRPYESWRTVGSGLTLVQELPWGFLLRANPSARRIRYRGAQALYGSKVRDDRILSGRLTVSNRNVELWGFRPRISFVHERRNSNISVFEYSRNYGDLEWVRNF